MDLEPVGASGSAGGIGMGGSSGAVGQGGTGGGNLGNGGTDGIGGTGATGGVGGSSDTGGTGGTSSGTGGTGGTGGGATGPINLVANSDFEQGTTPAPWTMIAQQGIMELSTDCDGPQGPEVPVDLDAGVPDGGDAGDPDAGVPEPPAHGLRCGRGTARTAAFNGPAYPLNGVLTRGKTYTVSAYGRIAKASSSVMKFTMRMICQGEDGIGLPTLYDNLTLETPVTDRAWLFMTKDFTVPNTTACPVMTDIRLYLEGPPAGIDILVDDVSVYEL